jgi:hypothetical protein
MKGRGKGSDWEVCRLWECPACGRKARTRGTVVNVPCPCGEKEGAAGPVWMRLVEDRPRRRPPRRPPEPGGPPEEET